MAKNKFDFAAAQAANVADEARKDAVAHGKAAAPVADKAGSLVSMTVKELRALAAEKGIKVNQRTSKAELIKAIETGVSPVSESVSKPGPKTGSKRGQYNLGVERKVATVTVPLTQREVDAIEARIKEDGVQRSVLIRNAIDAYLGL